MRRAGSWDGSQFAQSSAEYGPTLVTGFARIYGHPLGIVAKATWILFIEVRLERGTSQIHRDCATSFMCPGLPANITGYHVSGGSTSRAGSPARGE